MYKKIQGLMDLNHVSAYKMAKDLGFSRSVISEWKSGKSKPKADKIQKIAEYFNVPVSYFYDEDSITIMPEYYSRPDMMVIIDRAHDDPILFEVIRDVSEMRREDLIVLRDLLERWKK